MIKLAIQLPTTSAKHITDITPEHLKKLQVKAVLLDIDNTLAHHESHTPFDGVKEWINMMKEKGYTLMIISNNKERRVSPFAKELGLSFVCKAQKPLPKGYIKACKTLHIKYSEAVIIGDQIFTDIIGANMIGMKSILVEPAKVEDGFSFKVRRCLEKPIRKRIKKKDLVLKS